MVENLVSDENDIEELERLLAAEKEKLRLEKDKLEAYIEHEDRMRVKSSRDEKRRIMGISHVDNPEHISLALDDPKVTNMLSSALFDKCKKFGIADISSFNEQQILALGLNSDEMNELLDLKYLSKYLNMSPDLINDVINVAGIKPLSLWKLSYEDVNRLNICQPKKRELFGHVLSQKNSFVANVNEVTATNVVLKDLSDRELAFLSNSKVDEVSHDALSKRSLTRYINKLRQGLYYLQ